MSADGAPRRVLITGGSMGIGAAIAGHLAATGHRVLVAARGREAAEATVAALPGDGHEVLELDVAEAAGWDRVAERLSADGGLHGLVAAAGVLGPIGPIDAIDPADFSRTLAINVSGTALALARTAPLLERHGGGAVTLSGGGATGPLVRYDAYAASKAAVVRLTENVARDLAPRGVRVNAIAPGFVATRMHQDTLAAGPDAAGASYFEKTEQQLESGGADPQDAAELSAFLLSDAARGVTGRLLSAQWDPWREPTFQERLRTEPDLATLRRIDDQFFVPAPEGSAR
jgi:3-oxoacyl-[acyl-carrier protein] reductase